MSVETRAHQTPMPGEADGVFFNEFLERISSAEGVSLQQREELLALREVITPDKPLVYWSMEVYDKDGLDLKGGGGLGVLAADTRRVAEQLGIPLLVITPFYREESHQELKRFQQVERHEAADPGHLYTQLGGIAISTQLDSAVPLEVYSLKKGSTEVLTITEENFGELYPGSNSGDHRLYQEVALGFAGYQEIVRRGIEPPFMQLNEAPTVFAAIARLDDLCGQGIDFEDAMELVREQMLYTNHTLVQAVEGQFDYGQFEHFVMPNIGNEAVKDWVRGMFSADGKLKLSALAIELADMKSGVSELHARVADFPDRYGNRVEFEAVTNGISDYWILPEITERYRQLGIVDRFGLPAADYRERLADLDIGTIRELKSLGRDVMDEVLARREDQYGDAIHIPKDALVIDFKRRFANYKRPEMIFDDPERLAHILETQNMHFVMTGKPHPNDEIMKEELTRLLWLIDSNPVLKERVHYVQDYDEEVGRALAIGGDCAINVPEVGKEACGTSWMKDIANLKLLISTPDGGVADREPGGYLLVDGAERHAERQALYGRIEEAGHIIRDDGRYRESVQRHLAEYLPVISGARMWQQYLWKYAVQHARRSRAELAQAA